MNKWAVKTIRLETGLIIPLFLRPSFSITNRVRLHLNPENLFIWKQWPMEGYPGEDPSHLPTRN